MMYETPVDKGKNEVVEIAPYHTKEYGNPPEAVATAPGRLILLGDYCGMDKGYFLSFAVDRYITVAVSGRTDHSIRFYSADLQERKRTSVSNLKYRREDRWANHPKGVLFAFQKLGCGLKGMNVTVYNEIPTGKGFAASAAFDIASALALKTFYNFKLSRVQILEAARQAEQGFLGRNRGIFDHIISLFAKHGQLILLDTRSLEYRYISFPAKYGAFLITDSRVPQQYVESEYEQRRKDSKRCIESLNHGKEGDSLREFTVRDINESLGSIPELTRRRCLHVLKENQRVMDAENLIHKRDIEDFGRVLTHSHDSLRDQYEVSCPEIDWLVKRSIEIPGVYGSRLTGAGFGGCMVSLLDDGAIDNYKSRLEEYERIFGFKPEIFRVKPSRSAHIYTGKKS
ncbi:MAG: galactokinase [Spirochaetales bacterium]|nr:galactokinase [Spirochaetales bacterium]MCF7937046.1 galactokinase [Spirochaetales bacterium]